jgi:hypothetical protein
MLWQAKLKLGSIEILEVSSMYASLNVLTKHLKIEMISRSVFNETNKNKSSRLRLRTIGGEICIKGRVTERQIIRQRKETFAVRFST